MPLPQRLIAREQFNAKERLMQQSKAGPMGVLVRRFNKPNLREIWLMFYSGIPQMCLVKDISRH